MTKNSYIYGFATKGEVCVPTKVDSISDFVEKFGEPESILERHLFKTVKEQLEKNNIVTVVRIERISDIYEKCIEDEKFNDACLSMNPITFEPIFWKSLTPNEQISYRGMDQGTFGPKYDYGMLLHLNKMFPEGAKKDTTYFTAGAWIPCTTYGEERTHDLH